VLRHQSAFPSLLVFPFYPFLPSPRLSLSVSLSISLVFWFLCFGCSSLSRSVSLSFGFSPRLLSFSPSFFPPLFLSFGSLFIGAGGAGSTLPRPIGARAWGHVSCTAAVLAEVANGGVSCGARLLWHLIMMRVASDSGLKARGRKRQGEENKTSLPLLHVQGKKYKKQCRLKTALFNLSFFFSTHETASFFPKCAVSFK